MSYLIHERSQALLAKLSFFYVHGGLDGTNLLHLAIMCTSRLILTLIQFFFFPPFCQMCESVCVQIQADIRQQKFHISGWNRCIVLMKRLQQLCAAARCILAMFIWYATTQQPSSSLQPQMETSEMFHRTPQKTSCLTPARMAPNSEIHFYTLCSLSKLIKSSLT